jgi:predicted DNA-binding transcriptional regulator YafY
MPVADSASTSRRLLALLSLLQLRRDWPARVLADRLEVSERTVRRDVERLRELDYAVETTRGPDGGYRLGAGATLPPLLFDDEQALAIALLLRTAPAVGAGLEDAAERALLTLTRLLPSRLAHRVAALEAVAALPSTADATDAASLESIAAAISAREELRYDYATGTPGDPVRRIEAHHLLARGGRWYVVGFSAELGEWRILRVDRMTLRDHTGRHFEPREVPGGDAVAYLAARFVGAEVGGTWACIGEAVVELPLKDVAPFIGDGTATEVTATTTRVHLGSWSWVALASALLRFDRGVTEVEPAELRAAFATITDRATSAAN